MKLNGALEVFMISVGKTLLIMFSCLFSRIYSHIVEAVFVTLYAVMRYQTCLKWHLDFIFAAVNFFVVFIFSFSNPQTHVETWFPQMMSDGLVQVVNS